MGVLGTVKDHYAMYLNSVSTYGISALINRLKHKMGQEFYIPRDIIKDGKHFRKFMDHFIRGYSEKYFQMEDNDVIPFVEFTRLSPDTYIYVATGKYIPGKMEAALMDDNISEEMYIFIFGRNAGRFTKMLKAILKKDEEENSKNSIYVVNKVGGNFNEIASLEYDNRPLDSLVYSHGELKRICSHIDAFLGNVAFYRKKSIPYKTGILLYGEPGTGKSSMVKGIASYYKRNICQISVSDMADIDLSVLTVMLDQDDDQYIVLFEDIDTLFLNRDDSTVTDKDYNSIINKLLQFLDSNTSPTDVIFIATTNHIERLDKALLRDGRFDLKVKVEGLKKDDIPEYMKLLECGSTLEQVLEAYGETDEDGLYNQSKLQNILIRGQAV